MKRYGQLFEKVTTFDNLLLASKKAMRGKKDKVSVSSFYFNLEKEIFVLQEKLNSGTYRPMPYTQFEIHEPKSRKICSSHFSDRVVHHAICNVIGPLWENKSIFDSYACRRFKGTHLAVARCQKFTRKFQYFLKCDIKKYFESIDHKILKNLLRKSIKDTKILNLLDMIIDHKVPGNISEKGIPIGNLTSQFFANLYLGELDHFLKDRQRVGGYLRYMDDFISFANSKEELNQLLEKIESFTQDVLALELKEKVTMLAPVTEGVPFLGFRIYPGLIRIKRENLVRLRRKIRKREESFTKGKIDQRELIQSVNSMAAHVSQANSLKQRRNIFNKSLKLV